MTTTLLWVHSTSSPVLDVQVSVNASPDLTVMGPGIGSMVMPAKTKQEYVLYMCHIDIKDVVEEAECWCYIWVQDNT